MRQFDRRLLAHAATVRGVFVLDVVAGVLATVLLLAQVTVLAYVLADIVDRPDGSLHVTPLAVLIALVLSRAGLAYVVEGSGRRVASRAMSSLRSQLVERRLRHGGRDLEEFDAATMATAAVQGVDGLETYFARYLPQVVLAVTVPVAVVIWVAVIDVQSALILVITLPLIPLFMWLIGRTTAARAARSLTALVALSVYFLDLVRGLPTLRAFNRGRAQLPRIRQVAEQYRRTTMGTLRLSFLSGFVLDLATTMSIALVAVTLGVRLVSGSLELRPALTVLLLVPEMYAPIRAVGTLFHASADGLASAERILEILDRPSPSPSGVVAPSWSRTRSWSGTVELRGVTVSFPDRPIPALDGVDLRLESAEFLAIVGPSGAGKTTLGRVLLGLVRPEAGSVLLDDLTLTDDGLDDWRRNVAWAAQRPALVHDTVSANIALGRPDTPQTLIEHAARRAGAHDFIVDMPDGYSTSIGDGGRGLSAGQRQRIGLARALLPHARLLVLDEPTAYLDDVSAARVLDTLRDLRGSCTVVVLTHDMELAALADRVEHILDGRLHALVDGASGRPGGVT